MWTPMTAEQTLDKDCKTGTGATHPRVHAGQELSESRKTVTSTFRDGTQPSSRADSRQLRGTLHTGAASCTVFSFTVLRLYFLSFFSSVPLLLTKLLLVSLYLCLSLRLNQRTQSFARLSSDSVIVVSFVSLSFSRHRARLQLMIIQ